MEIFSARFCTLKYFSGYVRARFGRSIGRNRIAKSLRQVDPNAADARHYRANKMINTKVYWGRYFGYNLHMDCNEKVRIVLLFHLVRYFIPVFFLFQLVMFHCTIAMAMDGFSGMVVGAAVMALKNNIVIYDKVYR